MTILELSNNDNSDKQVSLKDIEDVNFINIIVYPFWSLIALKSDVKIKNAVTIVSF